MRAILIIPATATLLACYAAAAMLAAAVLLARSIPSVIPGIRA